MFFVNAFDGYHANRAAGWVFCTISGTEGGVVHVGLVKAPPVVRCRPFRGGGFVVVLCCRFWMSGFRWHFALRVFMFFSSVCVAQRPPFGMLSLCFDCF